MLFPYIHFSIYTPCSAEAFVRPPFKHSTSLSETRRGVLPPFLYFLLDVFSRLRTYMLRWAHGGLVREGGNTLRKTGHTSITGVKKSSSTQRGSRAHSTAEEEQTEGGSSGQGARPSPQRVVRGPDSHDGGITLFLLSYLAGRTVEPCGEEKRERCTIFLRRLPLRGGCCYHIRSDCRNENAP
jgi:hypothetical protein